MSGNKKNTLSKRVEQLEIIMGITNNGIIDKNGIVINMEKTKTKLEEIENKINEIDNNINKINDNVNNLKTDIEELQKSIKDIQEQLNDNINMRSLSKLQKITVGLFAFLTAIGGIIGIIIYLGKNVME